jgi:hypothetical protein
LALQSIYYAAQGTKHRQEAGKLLSIANELATQTDNPLAKGWTLLAAGFSAVDGGEYRQAVETLTSAMHHLRNHCRGAIWESEFAAFYAAYAALVLGDLQEAKARLQLLLQETAARGNLFASLQGQIVIGHTLNLAADKVERARNELHQALAQWTRDDFGLLKAFALNARSNIAIYAGSLHQEYEHWRHDWTLFNRSTFSRSESVSIWMKDTQARTLLYLATTNSTNRRRFLAKAAKLAKQIGRCSPLPSKALALLIFAQVAHLRGESGSCIRYLEDSIDEFERAEMKIYSQALRLRYGSLASRGQLAPNERNPSRDSMINLGIINPDRMLRVLTPGFHLNGPTHE